MKLNIAVLPGDGIGPEIIEQAMRVVKLVSAKYNHKLTFFVSLCDSQSKFPEGIPLAVE